VPTDPQRAIAGIVLAAGRGSRFGGDKLRRALPDGTLIGLASARALRVLPGRVVAVVAAGDAGVRGMFEADGFECVECADAADGMGASLACGVGATADAAGWLIALGDMPFVRQDTVAAVAGAIASGARIAAPMHAGRRGHPVGFAAALRDELVALRGDQGARAVIARHHEQVVAIHCDDAGTLADIDTPADLAAAVAARKAG
jgi:molybdenum cofactor cytidylyltransferase